MSLWKLKNCNISSITDRKITGRTSDIVRPIHEIVRPKFITDGQNVRPRNITILFSLSSSLTPQLMFPCVSIVLWIFSFERMLELAFGNFVPYVLMESFQLIRNIQNIVFGIIRFFRRFPFRWCKYHNFQNFGGRTFY